MSFYDKDTNVVYLSNSLKRHERIYLEITNALKSKDIKVVSIKDTQNIWCRDYMPLQVGDHFVKFQYCWGESRVKEFPQLKVAPKCYTHLPYILSDICLDGGNCVRYGSKTIMTDIIYRQNPGIKKKNLRNKLERLLESQIIILPKEPYDDLGHADGIVRFVDEDTVFVNDYQDERYLSKLVKVFDRYSLKYILFPYAYDKCPQMKEKEFRKKYPDADSFNPGIGYYINFLQVKNLILVPQFNFKEDLEALRLIRKYFRDCEVRGVHCYELAMLGGLLNCVTSNYKEFD